MITVYEIIDKYKQFTMVPRESILDTLQCVSASPLHGAFVEMGTWRGGICFMVAAAFRSEVWAFDSFNGLLAPDSIDGKIANEFWNNPLKDVCRSSQSELVNNAMEFGDRFHIIPGWFKDTINQVPNNISVLRIDCDWYESVKLCLDQLYDKVLPGGFVIIDDYSVYDGAAIATHEFLGRRQLSHRLYVVKGASGMQQARFCKT